MFYFRKLVVLLVDYNFDFFLHLNHALNLTITHDNRIVNMSPGNWQQFDSAS
jgi:hypothetical protein